MGVDDVARGLARRMDRRSFMRKSAGNIFKATAVVAAGGVIQPFLAGAAQAYTTACDSPGPGCPYGCGPSQCCDYSGRSSSCHCAYGVPSNAVGPGTTCASTTANCHGRALTWSGSSCWSCYGQWTNCSFGCQCRTVTTCCDCSTSGCGDTDGRCIGWIRYTQKTCSNPSRIEHLKPLSVKVSA